MGCRQNRISAPREKSINKETAAVGPDRGFFVGEIRPIKSAPPSGLSRIRCENSPKTGLRNDGGPRKAFYDFHDPFSITHTKKNQNK